MDFSKIKTFDDVFEKRQYWFIIKKCNDEIINECAHLYYDTNILPINREQIIAEKRKKLKYYNEDEFAVLTEIFSKFDVTKYTEDIIHDHIKTGNNIITRIDNYTMYKQEYKNHLKLASQKYCEIIKNIINIDAKYECNDNIGKFTFTFL